MTGTPGTGTPGTSGTPGTPGTGTPGTPGTGQVRGAGTPDAGKLRALAAQFESLLLAQMLKEMRASMFDDGEEAGLGSGPLSDALFSELSLALSRTGGIGLANAMAGPLLRQTAGEPSPVPGVPGVPGVPDVPGVPGVPDVPGVPISSGYGWRTDPIDGGRRFHQGVDIALATGTPVPSAQAGRVTVAGDLPGYGLTVVVQHADGRSTRYAHLSAIDVRVGDEVAAGQVIAQSGSSGRATGPHLHVELIDGGRTVNPAEVLRTYVQPAVTGR